MNDGLLGGLSGGLSGIDDAKEVKAREQTTLDQLTSVKEEMFKVFADKLRKKQYYFCTEYDTIYKQVKRKLRALNFNVKELSQFVLAESNIDYDHEFKVILGFYSGCLAQLITERNRSRRQKTTIYIDGQGNRFDYLFYCAKFIDNLVVENFKGFNVCSYVGANKGYADKVIGINIEGENALSHIGSNGYTNQIVGVDIRGTKAISNSGSELGEVEQIIAVNIMSNEALKLTSDMDGRVNQVVCVHVNGDSILNSALSCGAKINQLVYYDVSQFADNLFKKRKKDNTIQMNGVNKTIGLTTLTEDENSDLKDGEIDVARRIIQLANSLQGRPYNEVLEIADSIYELKPKVPRRFYERKDIIIK